MPVLKSAKKGLWLLNPTLTIKYTKPKIPLFTILIVVNNIKLILYWVKKHRLVYS
jgi:hypothetical protein